MFNYYDSDDTRKGQIMKIQVITYDPHLYANQRLAAEFSKVGVTTEMLCPEDLHKSPLNGQVPQLLRLGRYNFHENIQILSNYQVPQFNDLTSYLLARNKWKSFCKLEKIIPQPFSQKSSLPFPFLIKIEESLQGKGVFLIQNPSEFPNLSEDFFYQEFIQESAGHDYRVVMIEDQMIGAIERKNKNDFRSNSHFGSTAKIFQPPQELIEISQRVMSELGLFYSALDFVKNKKGQYLFLEANASPGYQQFEETTKINFAELLVKKLIRKVS
jgi:RimK family alpha-L-glutamate ligase